jgi:response regulator RpfG family c-di-GMP phosphodiesterase
MSERVLFVDDEPAMLEAFRRMLSSPRVMAEAGLQPGFSFHGATSAAEALAQLEVDGGFAVIVSDLRMPGMGGIEFFETAKRLAPATVRILLTGHVDADTALDAINRGSIFRFLTKPCAPVALAKAVAAGLEQNRLIGAERQLLEHTLAGTVRVLADVLGFVNPTASARSQRVRRYVEHMVATLGIPQAWRIEVAAMLSHLGCLAISSDLADIDALGAPMTPDMRAQFQLHPRIARDLLVNVPRLEEVAEMIGCQLNPADPADAGVPIDKRDAVRLGGQILHVAMAFDHAICVGSTRPEALAGMLHQPREFDPAIVASLAGVVPAAIALQPRQLPIDDLNVGMVLQEDLRNANGLLLMSSGHELTLPMLTRLRNMLPSNERRQMIRVLTPRADTDAQLPASS